MSRKMTGVAAMLLMMMLMLALSAHAQVIQTTQPNSFLSCGLKCGLKCADRETPPLIAICMTACLIKCKHPPPPEITPPPPPSPPEIGKPPAPPSGQSPPGFSPSPSPEYSPQKYSSSDPIYDCARDCVTSKATDKNINSFPVSDANIDKAVYYIESCYPRCSKKN